MFILCSCANEAPIKDTGTGHWPEYLSKEVTVVGIASNGKIGAFVESPDPKKSIWVDSLSHWPEEFIGNKVVVTGVVIEKHDIPVFIPKEGELPKTGIPVPEGTDLHTASKRFLLKNAEWKIIQ